MSDRQKNMCCHIVPVYYGERGVATAGKPGTSKDYYYLCYTSANKLVEDYRRAETIEALCTGCKKYWDIKPYADAIKEKFYKSR